MTRPIVGILGRKQAGKDTVAAHLVEKHGYVRYAFADKLRDALLALDPVVEVDHWADDEIRLSTVVSERGWEKAKELDEVRGLLQRLGTDAIRALDEDFWVRLVAREVDAEVRPVVITDVRFHNEAEWIRRAGGLLIRVTRPGRDPLDMHVSETELLDRDTDYQIHNDAGLDFLTSQTDWVAGLINRRYGK